MQNDEAQEIGFCMYAFGITMMIMRLFNFLLLVRNLGPIAISILNVGGDILLILTSYFSLLIGFGVGINNIMKNVRNDWLKPDECKHQVGDSLTMLNITSHSTP